jgi:hypothetical protein
VTSSVIGRKRLPRTSQNPAGSRAPTKPLSSASESKKLTKNLAGRTGPGLRLRSTRFLANITRIAGDPSSVRLPHCSKVADSGKAIRVPVPRVSQKRLPTLHFGSRG